MIVHNLDPILFKIGFLEIRYYGLVYLLGFLFVLFTLRKNKEKLKLKEDDVYNLIFYLFLGIIIGARIFHFVFSEPRIFISDPLELFRIWRGGMSFFGSLLGVILVSYIYCRKKNVSFYQLGDLIVIPATLFLILGRIANFINGEIVGTITNVPWCVIFKYFEGCRHPYQLYAAFSHFILLISLLVIKKIKDKKKLKDGILFIFFIGFYCFLRFLVDFFRDEPRFLGITIWQFMSLIIILFSLILFYRHLLASQINN